MSEQNVVSILPHDEVVLACVQLDRLDEDLTRAMQAAVSAAAQARPLPLLLDLSVVEFVPSLSLGALVTISNHCRKVGQRFILVNPQRQIREALAVTRLDRLFEICDSVEEALAQLKLGDSSV